AVKCVTAEREPIPQSKIHVVYNGYKECSSTVPVPRDFERFVSPIESSVVIGLVANIRAIKRIEDAIIAVKKLGLRGISVILVVIGDGDVTSLERLSVDQEVSDRVFFMGAREDVRSCLRVFDIGVLCSESEGFSNTIVEYMQAGLAIVCSSVGGNPEALSHGETGFLYPVGNTDVLVDYLERLIVRPELREEMA